MQIDYKCEVLTNKFDRKIFSVVTTPPDWKEDQGITAIVPPAYGKKLRNNLSCALYLNWNNIRVVRYDNTYHLGKSDGDIYDFTLEEAKDNINAVFDYYAGTSRKTVLVSPSLMFRAALRAGVENKNIKDIIGLVGVVNIRYALSVITGEDIVGYFLALGDKNDKWTELESKYIEREILGHVVSNKFVTSLIDGRLFSYQHSCDDANSFHGRISNIVSENDEWNILEETEGIFKGTDRRSLYTIPETLHELSNNPQAAKIALEQLVKCVLGNDNLDISKPTIIDTIDYNKIERKMEQTQGFLLEPNLT